ncbi:DNA primase [Buchnera aphidicola (Rhopalosiphum padi)]|uniref:DNA primase n=1 Tax=Buchnera aphidicola subsp. Rhopalosiphum padi TaxID=98793 RepID=A0A4D6Y4U8_BUCRP|nr:DNA primase [Buchnera aphidicola]QCI24716.1 DNA primase [Buchnera aphidicola (Rhopalosiphum padi)]
MSGTIPKYFINELLFRTNIVELIETRIKLKKNGKNYQTHCPFHNDKTPSFTVSYEKQFYYCFGCNAHGNAIDFLINYDNLNFVESIEELATIHSIEIPFDKKSIIEKNYYLKKQKLYLLMDEISKLYQKNVIFTDSAQKYLIERGINKNMIDFFCIGFSSNKWNLFSKKFNIKKDFEKDLLYYKIISTNKNGYVYDPFQGRIIFPIHDQHGRITSFGGRSITNNILPKYLNSHETDIFHKGKQIYGLYQVKKKHSKPKHLLVVEGYIDVIMLTQYNIEYVVSSLGTSITKEHIQMLFRHTNTVIYCYDGDDAGRNASWRTLKIALPYISDEKSIKFIMLPKNEDPDTIIKKEGKKKFQLRIDNALTMSKFFFKNILKNVDLSSNDDKFHLSVRALPLINCISSDTIRIYLRQILARIIGILDDHQFEKFLYEKERKNKNLQFQIKHTPMRTLISLLIQNPNLSKLVPSTKKFENEKIKGLPIFLEILKTCSNNPNFNTGQLLEFYRNSKIINILKILSKWDHMIIKEKTRNMFLDLLKNTYSKILEKRQEKLIAKERVKGLTIDEKKEIWSINKKLSKKNYFNLH